MKPTHIIIIIIITVEEEESSSIFQTSQFCDCHIKKTKKNCSSKEKHSSRNAKSPHPPHKNGKFAESRRRKLVERERERESLSSADAESKKKICNYPQGSLHCNGILLLDFDCMLLLMELLHM